MQQFCKNILEPKSINSEPNYLSKLFSKDFKKKTFLCPRTSVTMVSTHCDCPATVHLIYTMENGSVQLKNGFIQQNSKIHLIFFF